jgi:hypothetical protein
MAKIEAGQALIARTGFRIDSGAWAFRFLRAHKDETQMGKAGELGA